MGFKKVYECLREVFPQVDARILRAVAIENAKDVDAAVSDVLTEVIPFISEKTTLSSQDRCPEVQTSGKGEDKMKIDPLSIKQMADKPHLGVEGSCSIGAEESNDTAQERVLHQSDTPHLEAAPMQSVSLKGTETTSLDAPAKVQEDNCDVGLDHAAPIKLNDLVHEDVGQIDKTTKHLEHISLGSSEDFVGDEHLNSLVIKPRLFHENGHNGTLNGFLYQINNDSNTIVSQSGHSTESQSGNSFLKAENSDNQLDSPSFEDHSPLLPKIHLQTELGYQKSNASNSSNPSPKRDYLAGELSGIEDGLMGHNLMTQSGQLCRVDLLDEIIEDSKSNKITLFSAMESVINKMRKLEHKEKALEKAKEDAANGGWEIFVKVEELKRMLAHTKETNDMHAGEVYGEKAILATEARELQSRLLSLSDERDKSLSILDEMQTTLEARIAAVDAMQKAAEEEKLAKEENARNLLAEQEALVEKIVQESVVLRQEAEENTKLREFLIDRGRVVDTLQGEISVICQDVRQLKEKFDERVPLSKSLSSSQTSCILASSGSSLKSMASDLVRFCSSTKDVPLSDYAAEQGVSSNTPKKGSLASSVQGFSPKSIGEETEKDNRVISDDEWMFCDYEYGEVRTMDRKEEMIFLEPLNGRV